MKQRVTGAALSEVSEGGGQPGLAGFSCPLEIPVQMSMVETLSKPASQGTGSRDRRLALHPHRWEFAP